MARKRKGASSQMDLFAGGAKKAEASEPRRPAKRRGKGGRKQEQRAGKGRRRLGAGEVRTYTSKNGHRYELRRIS